MYGNKIPDFAKQNNLLMGQSIEGPVEDKQTALNRVSGALYQARELSEEVCQIAEMLLGPMPPANLANEKPSPTRMPGILNDIDDASDDTRRQMERAFQAIKRIRAAF